MKPSIGRIVIYTLPAGSTLANNGAPDAPATVVRVFDDSGKVNLKVHLDGPADHWATSIEEGTDLGTWQWPARV
jgi:hypothetical protein